MADTPNNEHMTLPIVPKKIETPKETVTVSTVAELKAALDAPERGKIIVNGSEKMDLSGEDFAEMDLSGVAFNSVNLRNVDLRGTSLQGTSFNKCLLSGMKTDPSTNVNAASFDGSVIKDTTISFSLSGGTFSGVDFSGSTFDGDGAEGGTDIDLRTANLRNTVFTGQIMENVDFSGSDLKGANLSESSLSNAKFIEADLMGAKIDNADLRGADFQRANLVGATITNSNLSSANLIGVKIDPNQTNMTGTNIHGARFLPANWNNLGPNDMSLALGLVNIAPTTKGEGSN